jgi:hypothetical protein
MNTITITVTDKLQIAGANYAWIAAGNPDQADAQAYLQAVIDEACRSYAVQGGVDRISSGEFVLRFTGSEFAAINAAAAADPLIAGFLAATRATPTVRLATQQTVDGLAYLVAIGLLTQKRSDEIGFYPIPVKPEPEAQE